VEHGRWSRRGNEPASYFSASTDTLAMKSLKLAARKKKDQSAVWREVATAQAGLVGAGSGSSTSASLPSVSPTSMQLALENKQVNKAASAYIRHFSAILDDQPDAIGYAFTINGKLNSADIYASPDLFRRMWPKMLKSTAMEALAEQRGSKASAPADVSTICEALEKAERGPGTSKDIAGRLRVVTYEADDALLFETRDLRQKEQWIHKSYVMK
jgi:hypothetical protein